MNDYKHDMGIRIKHERKKLNLTQENISETLNISVKHFSEVERGLTGLSVENIIKLSNILGVSIDYLLKGDKDYNKWEYVISNLDTVSDDKQQLLRQLIDIGISLTE